MPDNRTEDKINKENINKEAIVVTSEEKKNVFDFVDFVEKSTDENAIKLKRLMQYGITEEILLSTYKDIAGNIETEENVIASLDTIFSRLATYISVQPNGIIIDMATGLIDPEASFAQAIRVGIYSEDSIIDPTEDFIVEAIKNISKYDEDFTKEKAEEYIYLINNFDTGYINKEETQKDMDEFLNKDVSELSFSETLKQFAQTQKDIIAESKYEKDPYLFEISNLELEIEIAKGTPAQDFLLAKRKKFYEEHPKYIGKVPIRKKDGSINIAEAKRMNEYKEAYSVQYILSQIEEFKRISPEEFENQSEQVKHNIVMGIVAGLNRYKKQGEEFKEIVEECTKIVGILCPGLDFSNKSSEESQKKFAEFAKEYMGIKGDVEKLKFSNMVHFADVQIGSAVVDYIISNPEVYKGKKGISEIDINNSAMRYSSPFRNYFNDSNIEFSDVDEKEFNHLYKMVNINSWIENKETALKLRYAAMITIKKEYDKYPEDEFLNGKKEKLEKQIEEFEAEHGKLGMDGDELSVETKNDLEVYREYMTHAGLIKYFTRDAMRLNEGDGYDSLDDNHKKAYIRNVLACLKFIDMDSEFPFSKVALRRLELMNSDDKKFVTFDKNGDPIINEELILQEYQSMSDYKYKDFEELVQSATRRKDEYILMKLEEYSQLREDEFLKLEDSSDLDKSILQIEEIRKQSNQDRIKNQISNQEIAEAVKSGKVKIETLDDSAIKGPKIERETRAEDQVENDETINVETADISGTELKIEYVDNSATIIPEETENINSATTITPEEIENISSSSVITPEEMENINSSTTVISEKIGNNTKDDESFIHKVKSAFNKLKNFINKHIKKEKKVDRLGPGTTSSESNSSSNPKNNQGKTMSQAEEFNRRLAADVPNLSLEIMSQQTQSNTKQVFGTEERPEEDGSRQ